MKYNSEKLEWNINEYYLLRPFSNHDITCDQLVGLLEGAQCPLKHGKYVVKQQTHVLPDVPIPSFLKNVSYVIWISVFAT